jgi:UDP-glucose:(heptosyl)LPS alpha-1,3-glucosyltransferase
MTLAFCLYKYFPYGGLQRDFLRIAKECVDRGHQVVVYTLRWEGERPDWLEVVVAPINAMSSIGKYQKFSQWLSLQLQSNPVDGVVGFNKMPGLDVYYCADPCFEYKAQHLRGWWYRFSQRYRHFSRYEQAIFNPGKNTKIMMISEVQRALFQRYYHTEDSRMAMLPPGISRDRCAPENANELRQRFRQEYHLNGDDLLLLQVGSGFRTKGVDRSLIALASLSPDLRDRTQLFVIGQDDPSGYLSQAKSLGVAQQVRFFSGRDDIPLFLLGADLLVHPAYAENTGTVILEAIVAGLPVLVTDVCGYARYVSEADAGTIVPSDQTVINNKLKAMLLKDRSQWRKNAINFSKHADIYDMPMKAADIIDEVIHRQTNNLADTGVNTLEGGH